MPILIKGGGGSAQETPVIAVSSSGLITATAGDKSATKQLTTQAGKTVTPSTSLQTVVASGRYTTGTVNVAAVPTQTKYVTPSGSTQTITPDSGKFLSRVVVDGSLYLLPGYIKKGIEIFGVSGALIEFRKSSETLTCQSGHIYVTVPGQVEEIAFIQIQGYNLTGVTSVSSAYLAVTTDVYGRVYAGGYSDTYDGNRIYLTLQAFTPQYSFGSSTLDLCSDMSYVFESGASYNVTVYYGASEGSTTIS